MQAIENENERLVESVNPEVNPASNEQVETEAGETQEDQMYIWTEMLARVQWKIGQLEKCLDKKVRIYENVQKRIREYQRIRELQPEEERDHFPPLHIARVIFLLTSALNLADELAQNITDYFTECSQIRRKLRFLEDHLQKDLDSDKSLTPDKKPDPLQLALDYMHRVDQQLSQIFLWDEDDGANQ